MKAVIFLACKDLLHRWKLSVVMSLLFAISFACYLALITYHQTLVNTYFSLSTNWLVVQDSLGGGEIHGSRLNSTIADLLTKNGYRNPIPEIHQVIGSSISNAVMIRGFRYSDINQISPFTIVAGRGFSQTDSSRLAMIGVNLVQRLKIGVGDTISLRGRPFTVIGIFKNGSYEDNQAWISLDDAQKLLNYGSDVSVYYIPDGGKFTEGMTISQGVSIGRRGDSGNEYGLETMNFFEYLRLVGIYVGIATMITLINLLWRLSWLQRHEFGVLRTIGFGKSAITVYLLTEILLILLIGSLLGGLCALALIISTISNQAAFGISLLPVWDWHTIGLSLLITVGFSIISVFVPAFFLNKKTTTTLLGRI